MFKQLQLHGWHGVIVAVAVLWVGPLGTKAQSACLEQLDNYSLQVLQRCIDEVTEVSLVTGSEETILERGKSLKKTIGAVTTLQATCPAGLERATLWGCKICAGLAEKVLADGLLILRACMGTAASDCESVTQMTVQHLLLLWSRAEEQARHTPAETLVTRKLESLRRDVLQPLLAPHKDRPDVWSTIANALFRLADSVQSYIWKETHFLWLLDSLEAGRVVQTTWGDAEEWTTKFGTHDAHAIAPLSGSSAPMYMWSDKTGMRWDIMPKLLHELHTRRGGGEIVVVEIGVFAGHLSHFLLKDCDFINLIGVDPYIGVDGTFPGNFSETLDADVALYKAKTVFDLHSERARLLSVTSAEAAAAFPNASIDVLFVDGCHLYDCVVSDFDLWLPKLRRGVETLVAGHDFSPQWPGVVRAVHERRGRDAPVVLGTDWLFWWQEVL